MRFKPHDRVAYEHSKVVFAVSGINEDDTYELIVVESYKLWPEVGKGFTT